MSQGKVEEQTDEFDADLHGASRAGQHAGVADQERHTAHDFKELHDRFPNLRDDNLKAIPVLRNGQRLEQGGVYFDLYQPDQGEFRASGGLEAEEGHAYVAKNECDYELWNLLIGVDNPDRLGDQRDER